MRGPLTTLRTLTSGLTPNAALYFNGGTLKVGSAFSANGTLIESAFGAIYTRSGGAFVDTNGGNVSIAKGLFEDPASTGGGFTKLGAGKLTLSLASTYTGGTTVAAGVLYLGGTGASLGAELGSASNSGILTMSGGSLDFASYDAYTVGGLAGTGELKLVRSASGAVALTVGNSKGYSTTFSGLISGGGSLIKEGSGTLTLTSANTYGGLTTIRDGVVNIQNANALGTWTYVVVKSGAALQLQGGITLANKVLNLNGAGIASDGVLRSVGASNTYSGGITLVSDSRINSDTGLLTLSGALSGAFKLSVGGLGDMLFSGAVGNTGGLLKDGPGILTFTGASQFSGETMVQQGTLKLTDNAANQIRNSSVVVNAGALLEINITGTASTAFPPVTQTLSGSGTMIKSGAGTWQPVAFNNQSVGALLDIQGGTIKTKGRLTSFGANQGNITIASGATLDFYLEDGQMDALNGAGIFRASHTGTSSRATLGVAGGSGVFSGVIQEASAGAPFILTKVQSGTFVLSGANTFSGTMTVSGGVLNIQNATALGSTLGATKVASGAALQIQGGIAVGAEALTLDGTGVSSDGAFRNISGTNTYGGSITLASASRINSDSGLLTLSGSVTGSYPLSLNSEVEDAIPRSPVSRTFKF